MKKILLIPFLTFLFINASGVNGIGKPKDKYACKIDPDGFCIFTGEPHPLTLKPGTSKIFNLNGALPLTLIKQLRRINLVKF